MQRLLDVNETAKLLGISPWTVRSYIAHKKLCPLRIGRRVLIEEEEIERFIEQCRTTGHLTQNPVNGVPHVEQH